MHGECVSWRKVSLSFTVCIKDFTDCKQFLFPLPCGAGNAVPREGFDLSVIILASLLVFPMLGCRHSLVRLLAIFHVFVKWNAHFQTFLLVNTCQTGVIT